MNEFEQASTEYALSASDHGVVFHNRPRWIHGATRAFIGLFAFLAAYGCALSLGYAIDNELWATLAMVLVFALCLGVIVIRKRHANVSLLRVQGLQDDSSVSAKRWWRAFLVAFFCSCVLMLVVSIVLTGRTGRDYTLLFQLAMATLDGAIPVDLLDYYGAYPNNHLLLMFMIGLFDSVRSLDANASFKSLMAVHNAINVAIIMISVFLTAYSARRLWGRKRGALCGLVMLLYGPLWSNAPNPYTDTLALFFVACSLGLITDIYLQQRDSFTGACGNRAHQGRMIVEAIVLGVVCGIGFEFKATVGILVVAFAFLAFLHTRLLAAVKLAVPLVCAFAISIVCCGCLIDAARPAELPYDDQTRYERQFPLVHWVMMGLNADSGGQYTFEDYMYTFGHEGLEAKKSADFERLSERVDALGGIPGVMGYILADKAYVQWSNGGFFDETIFENETAFEGTEGWSQKTSAIGLLLSGYRTYTQAFHIILMGLVFVGALAMAFPPRRGRSTPLRPDTAAQDNRLAQMRLLIFCMVSLFGLGLFLCGIWEVKERYILQFAPMLIILGCEGLACLLGKNSSSQPR